VNRLIVLDTNVIVSAGISSRGHPSLIVNKVLDGDLVCVVCPTIAREYNEVLHHSKFEKIGFPPIWLDALLAEAHFLPQDPPIWAKDGPDKSDLIFLDVAHYVGAILITGNTKHFPNAIRKDVEVLTPAEYASLLFSS
jgi:putative PIN family toxin of toxin-antitoxin system